MAAATPAKPSPDPALLAPWAAYRLWSCTSRYHKGLIDRLTAWSLGLAVGGSILATLAEQLKSLHNSPLIPTLATALGVIATASIAVAAFLTQQAQSNHRVAIWTRSRSAAESLKSGIFLFRAGAPPFDKDDRAVQMSQQTEKIIASMRDVEPRQPAPAADPDLGPLTVAQYITVRVQEQIEWYTKRAVDHQREADTLRRATSVLLAIGAILTAVSFLNGVSAWAPVVATAAASITAFLRNKQYQMLTAAYSATALRLKILLGEWTTSGKTDADTAERNSFLQRCEETMSSENGSWFALWTKDSA